MKDYLLADPIKKEKCDFFISELDSYTFYVVDPFDKSYNPAKTLKANNENEKRYFSEMSKTLIYLCRGHFTL